VREIPTETECLPCLGIHDVEALSAMGVHRSRQGVVAEGEQETKAERSSIVVDDLRVTTSAVLRPKRRSVLVWACGKCIYTHRR
jgi:hypothetical protein